MAGTLKEAGLTDSIRDIAIQAPTYGDVRVLAADTAEEHTIPTDANYVVFSADGDFWAWPDTASPAVPSADVTDGDGPALNPTVWLLTGHTTIGLVADAARTVTMWFYK